MSMSSSEYIKIKENVDPELQKHRIYIAGPMSGHPDGNFPAFDAKEKQLVAAGWEVVNPAQMDRESNIIPGTLGEYDYENCASRDIAALSFCNAIYMMAGWQHSKGACWERALAKYWGLQRYYEIPRTSDEQEKKENKNG